MRTFNTGKITFEYPNSWEVEKADILSNPDCIATLSKDQDNLINAVMFAFAYPCIKPQEIFINCQRTGLILENILTITKSYLLPCSSRHCGQLLSSWISI